MNRKAGEQNWNIRIPKPIADAFREAAAADRRSINREIVWLMEEYVQRRRTSQSVTQTGEDKVEG